MSTSRDVAAFCEERFPPEPKRHYVYEEGSTLILKRPGWWDDYHGPAILFRFFDGSTAHFPSGASPRGTVDNAIRTTR